jgi:L-gulonolactone oxidase
MPGISLATPGDIRGLDAGWTPPGRSAEWRNWAQSARCRPVATAVPADEGELAEVLAIAADRGLTVRPVGSGHSFTPIAATDGISLRADRMTGLRSADRHSGLVRLGAGTRLRDVPGLIRPHGLAMANLGDIDAQTVAGAVNTGTHGTGAAFPGLAGQVAALRLMVADGSVVECSPSARPELFAAARLGLGAFGVVTEVTLACVPTFLLQADEHPEPWEQVVESFVERASRVDHLEFYWFPHTSTALVKANTRLPADAQPDPIPRWRHLLDDELLSNGALGAVCLLGTLVPQAIPPINRIAGRLVSQRRYTDDSPAVFTSPRRVRFREMEYGIDPAALPEVVRDIDALIWRNGWRISFPLEFRIAAADDIPLSTAFDRQTVYVAVHRFWREPYARYFLEVERILAAAGGRPHWGKLHTQSAATLRARYPLFDAVRAVRATVDSEGRFANPYLDRVLGPGR